MMAPGADKTSTPGEPGAAQTTRPGASMSRRPYTPDEDAIIVADMLAGLREKETAAKLPGRTATAIHNRRLNLRAKGVPGLPPVKRKGPYPDTALKKRIGREKLPRRECNTCPHTFQPRSPYERFCEQCRRGAVHDAGWALAL